MNYKGEHPAGITDGAPVLIHDQDMYKLQGLQVLIAYHTGKLDQFFVVLAERWCKYTSDQDGYDNQCFMHTASWKKGKFKNG